ncbi:TetR/AcrR family transcriptional regulator [Nocardiopsis potens]|uniref:TetR/AcrR family transcriptional regulator n=1 Tax=Nocardiopsis potens TaxID=1246458 RepID=UPI000347374F|nr:TetR/AcrR family transcriptional regulator [Nocardiopsis potens]
MATAAERGRQVRARLVEAAAGLIGERGWAGVSTRTVAERAGVAPGLVHYHYSSVQALLGEAALQVVGEVAAAAADELGPGVGLEEGIDRLLGTLDAFPGDDPTSRLFTEAYLAAGRDAELREGVARLLEGFRAAVAEWLRGCGIADPEATAAVVTAAVDGMMLHRPLDPGLTSAAVAPALKRMLGAAQ